jgi:small subunit ribosomal protein S9
MTADTQVYTAVGRRKTASARVRLTAGTGKVEVNGRSVEKYFSTEQFTNQACLPLVTAELRDKVDIRALVSGGGGTGQSVAVAHATARALLKLNPELRVTLKKAGHLTRDPRERERKKAGQPGARKRFQFSKR